MNRTYTPEPAPDVLDRLDQYAGRFRGHFKHPKQAAYRGVYLQGLLLDGDRKSIEPMARRVHLPDGVKVADPDQALQQFLGQSPWDDQAVMRTYRSTMADSFASPQGIFVADDTGLPKQGKHSVGVSHQYRDALGKQANCQVATSPHYVGPQGHFPLAMRLDLPKTWTEDAERLDRAGVPAEARAMRAKGQIALELLDQVRAQGMPGRLVISDAGYGVSGPFGDGLGERGLHYDEGGTGAGPPRGPVVAWVPPPRLPGDAGLRLPGTGARSRGTQPGPSGKKGGRRPVITLPAIRRALQRLLAPLCRHDCPYCRGQFFALRAILTE